MLYVCIYRVTGKRQRQTNTGQVSFTELANPAGWVGKIMKGEKLGPRQLFDIDEVVLRMKLS